MKGIAVLCFAFLSGLAAYAGPFQQAWDASQQHDASFQAARAELASAEQNIPMARALLLPNVSLSISDAQVNGTRSVETTSGQTTDSRLDYRSPVQSLSLRAPLFNREGAQKLQSAKDQVRYAQSVFAARKLELLDRLALAYLQRLMSEQSLQVAHAHLVLAQTQRDQMLRALQLGEGTKPEAMEGESALQMAKVEVLDAQNQLLVDKLSLRQITGLDIAPPPWATAPLTRQFSAADLGVPTDSLTEILAQADANNPTVAARRQAVELALTSVARNRSGHYPRLDLVVSATSARNESLSTLNQSVSQRSVGLQLNVPIFSGGYVDASVTQALADRDKADAELEAAQRVVAVDVTKAFFVGANSVPKIEAHQSAVVSSQLALVAASKGLAAGFATRGDVAQAQLKVLRVKRERSQVVSEYLLARVRLAALTGTDPAEIAAKLDDMLGEP